MPLYSENNILFQDIFIYYAINSFPNNKIDKNINKIVLFFFSVSLDPTVQYTWWSLLIGGGSIGLSYLAVNQVQVQRLMTVKYVYI